MLLLINNNLSAPHQFLRILEVVMQSAQGVRSGVTISVPGSQGVKNHRLEGYPKAPRKLPAIYLFLEA